MKQVIYKYQIHNLSKHTAKIPKGAIQLDFQLQDGTPTVWMLVHPELDCEDWEFIIYGTGDAVEPNEQYVGTFQVDVFVWHVFMKQTNS